MSGASRVPAHDLEQARREMHALGLFRDLPEEQIAWLTSHASFCDYEPGAAVVTEGEAASELLGVIRGEIRARREQKRQTASDTWLYVWKTGDVSGMLPFSRMTHYPVSARAVVPTRVVFLPSSLFPEMMVRTPALIERLVHIALDRARMAVRDEEQNQSLLALGKVAAGLAHELYNPTAAVLRNARELRQRFADFRRTSMNLAQYDVQDDALRTLASLHQREGGSDLPQDPIARSERLEQLGEWLDDRGSERAWTLAESFLDTGITVADLETLAQTFPDAALHDALIWLDGVLSADSLLRDVENAASRVAGLVDAVKSYSYMDRSPDKTETDIHAAIDSTLRILEHKVRAKGIIVSRTFDPELPRAVVHAGELNQVWTNLLDNAIDAVPDGGHIGVRTAREPLYLLVEITDDGPGIPAEIRSRIWEPFFTTKDVGKGTGLGLDIVQRIVARRHGGDISVDSEPGRTRFQVRLPLHADSAAAT